MREAVMHEDKGSYTLSTIPKKDWERIFGKHKPSEKPEHIEKRGPKPRVGRDDFTNRGPRWI
jgi:hypothetical protein